MTEGVDYDLAEKRRMLALEKAAQIAPMLKPATLRFGGNANHADAVLIAAQKFETYLKNGSNGP